MIEDHSLKQMLATELQHGQKLCQSILCITKTSTTTPLILGSRRYVSR